MGAIRIIALLLLCFLILDTTIIHSVKARFRGAQPKKIPSLAADGGVVEPIAGVRRTKGGLLPWWVRKRLQEQEQTGTDEGAVDKKLSRNAKKKAKTLHKNVEIVQLARDDREDVGTGNGADVMQSGDSAIVVKDLPLEDGADQGADDRLAAYDAQMGILAEAAKVEELSRGSAAEPDLLMDDAGKQAVEMHESAAANARDRPRVQSAAAASRQADADEDADEESEIVAGQEQGSFYDEGEDEDSRRRRLLQSPKKKGKRRRKPLNPEDVPGSVSRSLPDEVLPAEQEEAAAAGLKWPGELRQEIGDGEEEDDRDIVMTDVSRAERQAEQQNAVSDPGDSDNFEEGLLSAADEDSGRDAAVLSRETAKDGQRELAEGGRSSNKRARSGKRRRKGRGEGCTHMGRIIG
ncbi:hypothetical protein COCSUDRAFT_40771 [Coccomyxa subellipsoidea C-169]|uniref:Uncharacterized protein n=1 Tax=Coccomyxa subellipsoidea (strain C-169) TaxID=574566 RepID=I0Z4J4_COCSC|nr:hypothetical protein COCSUDRAFT_40771 [Coccomyxa subellipsoidea C-169]EIE25563.1 hypothetical protein COCSUDRAFT_40771 [Coccomyxa subellipsoidea C-169]|eukprot:XP_005650107.1 hypothetical protein COCSUDRAFT_40771 [Coccomyxa subellipsoidea C-169]